MIVQVKLFFVYKILVVGMLAVNVIYIYSWFLEYAFVKNEELLQALLACLDALQQGSMNQLSSIKPTLVSTVCCFFYIIILALFSKFLQYALYSNKDYIYTVYTKNFRRRMNEE